MPRFVSFARFKHGWRHDDCDQQHAGCKHARRDRAIGTGHHADCNDTGHELACGDCASCDGTGQQYLGGSPAPLLKKTWNFFRIAVSGPGVMTKRYAPVQLSIEDRKSVV